MKTTAVFIKNLETRPKIRSRFTTTKITSSVDWTKTPESMKVQEIVSLESFRDKFLFTNTSKLSVGENMHTGRQNTHMNKLLFKYIMNL